MSHWSALHHHGLTQQVPCKVFVLTTTDVSPPRKRGVKAGGGSEGYKVGGAAYEFIRVKPKQFFGMEQVWVGEARVKVTDPERTLLDGLSRPQYCGDFSEVLLAFETRLASLELEKIIGYVIRLDCATAKRLGWVLEHLGVDSIYLDRLLTVPVKGYRKLDPTGPRRGPCDRRWMIQVNLPGKIEI